ncbi:MAG: PLP-dependent aspartate aminotransferase family protein [Oscillospiraceae bacterium]|jgi:cystathionine beta-lyase|nr:PLP-dependent aspartate aminotransferase family protein [Oscillospiraceae bacterium]
MSHYKRIESALVHGGLYGDPHTGAVNTPIYQTSTYEQDGLGKTRAGWEYSRTGNPTRAALEALIAELEQGSHGFAFASGLAAIAAVLHLFQSGDSVVISSNVYGGTFRILDKVFKQYGLSHVIADTADLDAVERAFTPDVKAILIESPANPLLTVTDIAAVAQIAKRHGALTIVDNTFMTPYLQRPLTLGADIAVHSATKYLGGHSDLLAGLVAVKTPELADRIHFIQNAVGAILPPSDAFLLIRSIKTLGVRMDRHVANAETIAARLQGHGAVARLFYPGLPRGPGYAVQQKQARNGGAMISFELTETYGVGRFFEALGLVALAESLGGVESLACHPATMTHAAIPKEIRDGVGITENLIRLSVGIENVEDIWEDLSQAIEGARG